MKRVAFKMKLNGGFKEEYRKRHSEIWPELVALLKKSGISDYSIFYDEETGSLFAVQQVNESVTSQELGDEALMKKWWKYMSDIMETNPDLSPVSLPLEEVFYMK